MLPIVTFQNVEQTIKSIEDFAVELDKFDAVTEFELWLAGYVNVAQWHKRVAHVPTAF